MPTKKIVCACLLILLSVSSARAVITLDGDFDHGGLDEANSSVAGNLVMLAGRDNYNAGDWKWLYFSADGVNGLQPTFRIGDNFNTGGSSLVGHAMVYSYDQENWSFFDNNARSSSAGTFTFSNNSAFTQNQVWVAYGLPYSAGRTASHTSQLVSSPWVSPTLSGNSSLVIGQSPGGIDDLGRTVMPQDMYGYKISDPTGVPDKKKIALVSGVHSNETLGNYNLEGLVDFLVSDDIEASLLRKYADFYVYPMANPDGRFAGYNRSTVQRESLDPNRYWVPPNYNNLDDIEVVGDALIADTGGDVDYLLDFHSTVNGKDGHHGLILPAYQSDPMWLNLLQLDPGVHTQGASLIDDTGAKFGRVHLNAEFSATFETQFLAGENIDRFLTLGRNFGLAFERTFVVAADLNFDGQLTSLDWNLFLAGSETNLSILSPIDAYAAGDLNGDGFNDIIDFGIFKNAYVLANGLPGFQALFTQVPEPNSKSTTLIALFCLALFRISRHPLCSGSF
ncbi:Zinc carboxypeptidase [Bythopirellula polymerisocia]|uniref:Zinc carboxypeptidase n=2 Tax=Bythopirellula polymerisocia TaxID=2528003 RepID=A0A5C6D0S2_9BACT|nr:Zinc carboxypeptidase [Bythopirellula polymerisocia]